MHIDKSLVHTIAKGWEETHSALTEAARTAGDTRGDWAPAVRAAVTTFANSWRADLAQLAAEAQTTQQILTAASASYAITDEDTAERLKRVQKSVAPPA